MTVMKNLLIFAMLFFLSGCTIKKDLTGNWVVVYVGEGENVRKRSTGVPHSIMHKSTFSFSESGDVQLLDVNKKLLSTCKYFKDETNLQFKECSGEGTNTETTPGNTYKYEFESGHQVNLYSTDFKRVLRLERSHD
jgi:hypothetical protein